MDYLRISGTEPSSVIPSQTEYFQKLKIDATKVSNTSWSQKGWCNKATKLQFQSILTRKILMLSKRYESTEVDHIRISGTDPSSVIPSQTEYFQNEHI